MPRKFRRKGYVRKYSRVPRKLKYSNETRVSSFRLLNTVAQGVQSNTQITEETDLLGTRKVKNFTVSLHTSELFVDGIKQEYALLAWALVYVPEGLDPSSIHFFDPNAQGNKSFYEPNQNVIMAGLLDNRHCIRLKSRLARNLNSGDRIFLCICDPGNGVSHSREHFLSIAVNYAISF